MNKKIYYVIGEQSGDQLAYWHSEKYWPHATLYGTGGSLMQQKMSLDVHIKDFSCIGGFKILTQLPKLHQLQQTILRRIIDIRPDQVILVNFSSFNLSLAKKIKQENPFQPITFFSPPQLWIWGAWRVKKIEKYINNVEVIFPFEVEWYAQRGLKATYVGSPVFERYKDFKPSYNDKLSLICLPGSRRQELERTLSLFVPALQILQQKYPEIVITFAAANQTLHDLIQDSCSRYYLKHYNIADGSDLHALLISQQPTVALTKPGTNTLELAFAGIPSLVAYKMCWPLYWLARILIKIPYTALPNLLLNQEFFPEIIQHNCTPETIAQKLEELLSKRDIFDYALHSRLIKMFKNQVDLS